MEKQNASGVEKQKSRSLKTQNNEHIRFGLDKCLKAMEPESRTISGA